MSNGVGSPVGSGAAGGSSLRVLGWAAYLACSWTWCIGMFLPVLVVRDYGPWGFVVFAVPNVIGAAAMGWVLRRPGHSEGMVKAHRKTLVAFSIITVCFQAYFFGWFARWSVGEYWPSGVLLAFLATAPFCLRMGRQHVLAAVILAFSWIGAAANSASGALGLPAARPFPAGLAFLAPVCVFGFALCPYLDLTFHRSARSLDGRSSIRAFAVGFGALFLSQILLTLLYGYKLQQFLFTVGQEHGPEALIAAHIILQLAFTVFVHAIEVGREAPGRRIASATIIIGAILLAEAVRASDTFGLPELNPPTLESIANGEVVYRLFMSFYGLLFPAYVWLCMIPTWRRPAPPTARQLAVWLGACLVAAPLYWMGFIERREWWLAPGLAVVLLARLLIPRGERGLAGPSGAPVPAPRHPPPLAAGVSAGPDHQGG